MLKRYKKGVHMQSDEEETSTSMEDDSNNNPSESKGSSMNEKGKASRGSATDLQSLYARVLINLHSLIHIQAEGDTDVMHI